MCHDADLTRANALSEPREPFRELFADQRLDESPQERAARLAAAGDVLADLLEQSRWDSISGEDAWYALQVNHRILGEHDGHAVCRSAWLERAA